MPLFPIFYGLIGLIIGSFLNVCIYRLPRRESVVFPRSHCTACGAAIRPYDNIPLISFLLLAGKCRFCKNPIFLQYPAVEFLTGVSFFACARIWGLQGPTFVNSLFIAALIVLVFVDYQHQILPNAITIPGIVAGIALSFFQTPDLYRDSISYGLASAISGEDPNVVLPAVAAILGAAAAAGLLFAVAFAYKLLRKIEGLGMGDVKMMAMVGAFLGWRLALLTIMIGSVLGSLVGIFLIVFRGKNMQSKLAFGTFLGSGAVVALFFGIRFLKWYTLNR